VSYIINDTEHKHDKTLVVDDAVLFRVDPVTRRISKVSEDDIVLIKGDHNSERYRIALPRYIDGHDMSLCDIARVHYINIASESRIETADIYEATDLALILEDGMSEEDATEISFTWLVSRTATVDYGTLVFTIELACSTEDKKSTSYSWNSGVYSNITVDDGINNSKLITSVYGDILQGWWEKLTAAFDGAIEENSKEPFRFWLGTQAEYDSIVMEDAIIHDCLYYITDEKNPYVNEVKATEIALAAATTAQSYAENNVKSVLKPQIENAQKNAEAYADRKLGAIPDDKTVKDYIDSKADATLGYATIDTSSRIGDIKDYKTVKEYVDSMTYSAYNLSKKHTNDRLGDVPDNTTVREYIDNKVDKATTAASTAETNAKTHTDTKLGEIPDGQTAKSYVDNKVDDLSKLIGDFGNVDNVTSVQGYVDSKVSDHTSDNSNPHGVTAEQVGAYDKSSVYTKVEVNDKVSDAINTAGAAATEAATAAETNAKDYTDDKLAKVYTQEDVDLIIMEFYNKGEIDVKTEALANTAGTVASNAEANAKDYAKTYTDSEVAKVTEAVTAAEANAKDYTNTKLSSFYSKDELTGDKGILHNYCTADEVEGRIGIDDTNLTVKEYVDAAEANAKDYAKTYTDSEVAKATAAATAAETSAKNHTNTMLGELPEESTVKSYVDDKISKVYEDCKIVLDGRDFNVSGGSPLFVAGSGAKVGDEYEIFIQLEGTYDSLSCRLVAYANNVVYRVHTFDGYVHTFDLNISSTSNSSCRILYTLYNQDWNKITLNKYDINHVRIRRIRKIET
jgi:hypothetical protein